jgi:lipopolysaccharide export system protein LptA
MKRSVTLALLACYLLLSLSGLSQGQLDFKGPGGDTLKLVHIVNPSRYSFVQLDSVTGLTTLVGDVKLRQENTIIYCDSLISNDHQNFIETFGHVHIHDDSTDIYSDYMKYRVDLRTVDFQKNVRLTDGKGVLTTDALTYDLNTKVGVYDHGGKIVNNGSVLTSDEGTYYEASKNVYFRKNVILRDPQYDLSTDSLLYNTETQLSTFITETYILFKDSTHRSVTTSSGYYDLKHRQAQFGKRPIITDGSQRLTGDNVQIDDSTGISTAIGHAIYRDTAQGISILANYMISNKKKNTFLATQRPVMILKQDKDSIYITADTLYSARLIDAPNVVRKTSIADSLHRKYVDSLYRQESDSLHQVAAGDLSGTKDSSSATGRDSTGHRVLAADESHPLGPDSANHLVPDTTLRQVFVDTVHRKVLPPPPVQGRQQADSLKGAIATVPQGMAPSQTPKPRGFKYAGRPQASPRRGEPGMDTATGPLTAADSSLRYIQGFHHVRIFSDSLQAVADSLYYSGKDSIFRLYYNPIAWGSPHYQVTGDTMFVYTKNKKASRLYVFENALTINKVGTNFYNQIKGTTINCYFKDGEVDYMRAKGNAESIYYVQDDYKAYTGVNKAHADIIDMIFERKEKDKGKELNRVVLRNDAEGTMIPFRKVNFDDMRLRGFKWLDDKRPKSKEDLLNQ